MSAWDMGSRIVTNVTWILCFNEAQACPPGIWNWHENGGPALDQASMRPRRVRLGYGRTTGAFCGLFSACFNEAQACPPGIWPGSADTLRRWHCFNEAQACPPGIWSNSRGHDGLAGVASMRPRRVRLGYVQRPLGVLHAVNASMRPRRVRLGYGFTTRRTEYGSKSLQ